MCTLLTTLAANTAPLVTSAVTTTLAHSLAWACQGEEEEDCQGRGES